MFISRNTAIFKGSKHKDFAKIFLLFLASREYNELLIRSSDGLPPNPRWAENNPEYHHPAGHENEGNLHTNELKWARTIALPESLSPYYPLAEDKIRYAYERVSGGLSPANEALKLANDSIAYSIRKTVSSIPSLQERYRHDCELQQKIEQYKAEGKKIPATWIKNPFYQRYYREKNLLQE